MERFNCIFFGSDAMNLTMCILYLFVRERKWNSFSWSRWNMSRMRSFGIGMNFCEFVSRGYTKNGNRIYREYGPQL